MRHNIFWDLWLQRLVLSELHMSVVGFSLSLAGLDLSSLVFEFNSTTPCK